MFALIGIFCVTGRIVQFQLKGIISGKFTGPIWLHLISEIQNFNEMIWWLWFRDNRRSQNPVTKSHLNEQRRNCQISSACVVTGNSLLEFETGIEILFVKTHNRSDLFSGFNVEKEMLMLIERVTLESIPSACNICCHNYESHLTWNC